VLFERVICGGDRSDATLGKPGGGRRDLPFGDQGNPAANQKLFS